MFYHLFFLIIKAMHIFEENWGNDIKVLRK